MQQLTAREWIELIADPEIREKALVKIKKHPYKPDSTVHNIKDAINMAFMWDGNNYRSEEWL